MDTMKYAKLTIKRNVMESIACTVPLYEAPILEAIHGASAMTMHGETEREVEPRDVNAEHARLMRLYGRHDESGLPLVEYVYGRPTTGQLEKAIEASIVKRRKSAAAA